MNRISLHIQFWIRGLPIVAVLLASCGGESSPVVNSGTRSDDNAILITTASAATSDLSIWLHSVGRVHSEAAPTLAAEVEGRITKVIADTGERVEQGQLLAEVDTSTLILQRRAALAGLERLSVHIANGERRVDRYEKLSANNLSSQTLLDDAREQLEAFRADHKAARAELAIVDDELAKSRVVSPVQGVVQQRLIATGDFVKRGQALFTITNPTRLQAWLPYPESSALQIEIGHPVVVTSPLVKGVEFHGQIDELQPALGFGNRAVMTITDIDSPGELKPEATIAGRVLVETRQGVVVVPDASVVRRPAGEVVYLVNGDLAQERLVATGYIENGNVEILDGLEGGEIIAVEGAAFLTDGARVKVRRPE